MTEIIIFNSNGIAGDPVKILLTFDEYNLDAHIEYRGKSFGIQNERPTESEILEENGAMKLSLFIISKNSDKIKTDRKGDINTVHLHFEH